MKTLLLLALACSAHCMDRVQGWCQIGNRPVVTSGQTSTTKVQGSYPFCVVNVYVTGSGGTRASLFSDAAGSTPISNPTTADSTGYYFLYTPNGHVDVQLSGGTPAMPSAVTFGDIDVFEFGWTLPSTSGTGCWYSGSPGVISFASCLPASPTGSVQFNSAGGFGGTSNFTWSNSTGLAVVAASPVYPTTPALAVTGQSTFIGNTITGDQAFMQGGVYNAVTQGPATSSGLVFSGYSVVQSPSNYAPTMNGGYIVLSPINYNPYNGSPCFDQWGNAVQQPLPVMGGTFGVHDAVLWVGTSPTIPSNGSCGQPLPGYVDDGWGLNSSRYFFARGGLATDNPQYNSIQSLLGGSYIRLGETLDQGIYLQAHATSTGLNTPSASCVQIESIANCYGGFAYQGGSKFWYFNNTSRSWNTVDFAGGGGGGGGTPGGGNTQIQYNNSGSFGGSAKLTWSDGPGQLTITGYAQATVGFLSTGTNTDSIQAPNGGVTAKWLIGTDSLFLMEETAPALSGAGQARVYADSSTHHLLISQNGGAYSAFGGGGTPGGVNTSVQFNNSGTLGGDTYFYYNSGTHLLTVQALSSSVAGIAVGSGFVQADQGFIATSGTCVKFNCLQAPTGGIEALSLTAANYIQIGNHAGAPTLTTSDAQHPGMLYWDTVANNAEIWNGSAYVALATGGATTPGGATTNIQFNSGGSFGGSSALTWTAASTLLNVTTPSAIAGINVTNGYVQSDAGFETPSSLVNAVQAPNGGVEGKWIYAGDSLFLAEEAAPALSAAGQARIYANSSTHTLLVSQNGGAYAAFGGGGGTPGGSNTQVQFNNSSAFGGSNNFTWNNAGQLLSIAAASSSNAGLAVSTGFIQADAGFLSGACTRYNCFQVTSTISGSLIGGMAALSFTAQNYIQTGNSNGVPALTSGDSIHGGAQYFDTGTTRARVYNGSSWLNIATGDPIPSINTLTGALTLAGTANEIILTPTGGNTITFSTPQAINTSANVNFGTVTTTGTIQSQAAGAAIAFQTSSPFNFQVDGNGNVSAAGSFNTIGVPAAYKVGGVTIVDSARQATFANLTTTGVIAAGASVSGTNIASSIHYISTGTQPTTPTAGCNIGTGSTDAKGSINCPAGTSLPQVNFASSYGSVPVCVAVYSSNGVPASVFPITATANVQFGIVPSAGNEFILYHCMQ